MESTLSHRQRLGQRQDRRRLGCYLGHPEAVEILQKFEGVVELALGQMLCHHRPADRHTNTSPRRSQLHTYAHKHRRATSLRLNSDREKYSCCFLCPPAHLPDASIQSVQALSDPRWGDIRGVFVVGSSRDVGDVFKGCCRDGLDRRIIGGLNTSLLPVFKRLGGLVPEQRARLVGWSHTHARTRPQTRRYRAVWGRSSGIIQSIKWGRCRAVAAHRLLCHLTLRAGVCPDMRSQGSQARRVSSWVANSVCSNILLQTAMWKSLLHTLKCTFTSTRVFCS